MHENKSGLVTIRAARPVEETVEKLKQILQSKEITLFALVDHSGEAAKAGMMMPNTKLLIFGNPKAGTPLMLAAPSIAIDLPLKILVAEDGAGQTSISYNSVQYLAERHGISPDLLKSLSVVEGLAAAAAS
jgi:uncharacterized protein (DUF302 family)